MLRIESQAPKSGHRQSDFTSVTVAAVEFVSFNEFHAKTKADMAHLQGPMRTTNVDSTMNPSDITTCRENSVSQTVFELPYLFD